MSSQRSSSHLALAVAGVALLVAVPRWFVAAAPPPVATTDGAQAAEIERLRDEVDELRRRVAGGAGVQPATAAASRTEVVDWARIGRMIDERLAAAGAVAAAPATPAGADEGAVATMIAELEVAGSDEDAAAVWARIAAAGAIDDVVDHFEQLAQSQPSSPDAQTALGTAYIQKMLATDDPALRIELGKKIEGQFAQALELDPDHWEARFRQAVGQSHAAPLSGKRSEAIANFERLVAQQADGPAAAGHEQTYVFLGRLYAEQGNEQKAAEIWRLGLMRHPGNPSLRELAGR